MNMVVIVDREFRGEVENRLQRVGRYHPSRLLSCNVEPGRQRLAASVRVGTVDAPAVRVDLGRARAGVAARRRAPPASKLDTILDPLVVTDLATMVWSPHGYPDAVDELRKLAQIALIDSQDEQDVERALLRADSLTDDTYVVDLAWLRSTPWRERVAAGFDSPRRRPDLKAISAVTVRHREDSLASGVLFCGWLASRLGWNQGS